MKLILTTFVLVSILSLYGNYSLSFDLLASDNSECEKQVDEINAGNLYNVQKVKENDHIKYIDHVSKMGRTLVNGQVISYMWSSLDKLGKSSMTSDISGTHDNWGLTCDAMLRIGAELKSVNSDINYGADFQIVLSSIKERNVEKKAALNKGSKIFASTSYGDFSIGYQEGVESIMKLDASSIIAGDESNSWAQHIRGALSEKKNALGYRIYPFILSPGLYSENVFRNNDNAVLNSEDYKDFMNNLPLRINYQSPSFVGLRFGVSYAPTGYEFDIFSKEFSKELLHVVYLHIPFGNHMELKKPEGNDSRITMDWISKQQQYKQKKTLAILRVNKMRDLYSFFPVFTKDLSGKYNVFFGSKYEHILSGSIAFNYDYNDIKFSTSVVGEYAHPRLYFNAKDYEIYPLSYDLKGLSVGSVINYNNISFASAYGYLGRSGFVEKYYYNNVAYPLYERPGNAYYWDVGLSYQYKSYYFSVAYFKSRKSDNVLQDINLGFEYNLLQRQSKVKCKIFSNYHHYRFSEVAVLDDRVHLYSTVSKKDIESTLSSEYSKLSKPSLQEILNAINSSPTSEISEELKSLRKKSLIEINPKGLGSNSNTLNTQQKSGVGNVLLIGMKLEF